MSLWRMIRQINKWTVNQNTTFQAVYIIFQKGLIFRLFQEAIIRYRHKIMKKKLYWLKRVILRLYWLQILLYSKHPIIYLKIYKQNGKAMLVEAWTGLEGSERLEVSRFQDSRNMKVVRLLVLRTGHLYLQEIFLVLFSVRSWVVPTAGRVIIGNRTRDLPACSAVPQPHAPPRGVLNRAG